MKFLFLVLFFFLSYFSKAQQDIEMLFMSNWTYPQTFCDHGGPQDHVKIAFRNNGVSSTVFGGYIYMNYRIDGGAIIRDSLPALGGGAVWQFDFPNRQEDFSACGDTFDIETWVEYAFDPDQSNDTLAYQFINFCSPIPGTLLKDSTYQNTNDLDTLVLLNSENTTNYLWQYSLDSLNWQDVLVNDTSLAISYVDTLRYYRVVLTNPECPTSYSNPVKIRYLDPSLWIGESGKLDFRLYPNPTSDYVYFSTEQKVSVVVYDLNGKVLFSETEKKVTHKISMLEWKEGVYILKYIAEKAHGLIRIVKN